MEGLRVSPTAAAASSGTVANQRIVIFILTVILIFSLLGAQSFTILYNIFSSIVGLFTNIFVYLTANLGYSTGSVLQTTSNVASNAAISSAQIADGAVDSIGGIFRDANSQNVSSGIKTEMDKLVGASQNFLLLPPPRSGEPTLGAGLFGRAVANGGGEDVAALRRDLDNAINKINNLEKSGAAGGGAGAGAAAADSAESPIQKPITATKAGWCLAGEYQGKRGCVAVAAGDRCLSGKYFESKDLCLK